MPITDWNWGKCVMQRQPRSPASKNSAERAGDRMEANRTSRC
ncbi:MAG: hypothetical protein AVDCRST_MAG91-141 [uncultured Sphingomonadaceae bacterium]|uniref:Uncharacterized protein n=1 Tax=uncultured Sphingomonadaceae bacterium TaxID=169976 RepID=A0A6J4RW34_9SPHN|nr:MAG: hypothetical protein AVDCRST_MAG91-141 [uncultured Sphingomonadaceae bacterium]